MSGSPTSEPSDDLGTAFPGPPSRRVVSLVPSLTDRLGVTNVFAGATDRYPKLAPDDLAAIDADLVVFPDEPYAFTPDDGPEAWPQARPVFVDGRSLTWYGPSLVDAREALSRQLFG